ncbi:MAG TPA: DUF86 domain-containing protein [Bacillota bacterium]|nr:DUF86 domain-containing protein [Bacillota bacterium]
MLDKYLEILRQLSLVSLTEFTGDPRNYGSAERFLQLAIETTLNIGNHIISAHNFEAPQDYSDIFLILGKHNILPGSFAEELANMALFRNRLVHVYWEVDTKRVYNIIQKRLGDFEDFKRYLIAFLSKTGGCD